MFIKNLEELIERKVERGQVDRKFVASERQLWLAIYTKTTVFISKKKVKIFRESQFKPVLNFFIRSLKMNSYRNRK